MSSKEWCELRKTFAACAPKAIAATTAAVMAIDPEIDLSGADRFYGLTKEPTDVTYEEITAADLPAIWANPLGCDTERVLVYFHGGGFVSGSKDSYRKIAAHLAKAAGIRTLIPDYRLAPMNPFPAQLEDARSLCDWLLAQGYQPSNIAFAGDSAGGNIATGAALALNQDGAALPGAVVAFSPWYDMEANGPTFDSNAAVDVAISRQLVHDFAPMFLGGQSPADPLANPLYADPAGLPPLLLTCGGDETLRDSVERFAALAEQTGVEVALHVADGMPHVYQLLAGRVPEADASIAEAGKWLRENSATEQIPAMRFAISIPQTITDGSFDPTGMHTYLAHAEELGFDSAWTGEQVLGTQPLFSPLETLTYAAARTRQIRLGCAMLVSPLHNPVHLAKTIASVDQLSRGRVEIGMVTGGPARMFSAFGIDPASYVARFSEGLRLMRQLWTQPRVDFDGRFWQLRNAAMEPKPVQQPHPPIWFGGSHPNALARAVRYAHGFIGAGSSTTAAFAQHARIARDQLHQQQRDPARFTLAKRVYIAVDNDANQARDRITDALEHRYGYFGMTNLAAVPVAGTVDDCVAGLHQVATAGAQMILLNPLFDELNQMHRLATEVIPRLASTNFIQTRRNTAPQE